MTQYSVCVCIAKQFCKGPRCQIGTLDPIQSLNTKKKKRKPSYSTHRYSGIDSVKLRRIHIYEYLLHLRIESDEIKKSET